MPGKDFDQPMPDGAPDVYGPGELLEGYFSRRYYTTPCPSATFIRTSLLERVEPYVNSAHCSAFEDQYLWWHIAARFPIAVHKHIWVRHRQHARSAFRTLTKSRDYERTSELAFLKTISEDLGSALPTHALLQNGALEKRIATLSRPQILRYLYSLRSLIFSN